MQKSGLTAVSFSARSAPILPSDLSESANRSRATESVVQILTVSRKAAKERAREPVRHVHQTGGEEDVQGHGAEAELLTGLVAPQQQDVDDDVHRRPGPEDDVDRNSVLRAGMRRDVVQDRKDDEKEPPEQDGDALTDEAAVGVEGVVDQAGAELLPESGVGLGQPQHSGRGNRLPRRWRESDAVFVNRGHK